jgi:viroplasmin and RNaseH domain-containing protein
MSWLEAKHLVENYPGARYKSFTYEEDAEEWLDEGAPYPAQKRGRVAYKLEGDASCSYGQQGCGYGQKNYYY